MGIFSKNKDRINAERRAARERGEARTPEQKLADKRLEYENKIKRAKIDIKSMKSTKDFTHYVVSTSDDERVCAVCKRHSNKKYAAKDAVVGVNYPPFCDICRCVALPVYKGMKMP